MHEFIAVLLPEQAGARRGVADEGVVNRELGRLAGLNLGAGYYDAWCPVDPGEWLGDPSLTRPVRGEIGHRGRAGWSYEYPVFFAEDMLVPGMPHLGAIVAPDGTYHRDWESPENGASEEDYELFDRHRDCLVVVCDVHF